LPGTSLSRILPPMPGSSRVVASARLIAALTMGSRILGLIRECVFSYFFSTTELLSAFRIAFVLPNLARRLFGEGALSAAMIPTLTASLEERGEEVSRRFVGTILTVLVVVLVVGVVAAEVVIAVWRSVQDDLALRLATILMPYMALICTVAVAGGVLNVRGHFATPAAAPMILNLGIIAGSVGGATWAGLSGIELMYAVCVGVLVAGVAQLFAVGLALRAVSFFPVFGGSWRDPRVRSVFTLMAPMVIGLSAVQINTLADYVIAYLFIFVDGQRVGPAVLGYAQYLYQLPLGVFGISIATAVFPLLSQHHARGDLAGMADSVRRALGLALFIALPASVGMMFVATPLVATLYERGEFDAQATHRVAGTLVFYSVGLAAYFVQHILVRAFYALHDSRTPARVAMYMVLMNLAMNLTLVFVLQERGLALATAVCAAIQVVWLFCRLRSSLPGLGWQRLGAAVGKSLAATGVMCAVLAILASPWVANDLLGASNLLRLLVLVFAGVVTYALASRWLGIEEMRLVLRGGRAFETRDDDPGRNRGQ